MVEKVVGVVKVVGMVEKVVGVVGVVKVIGG